MNKATTFLYGLILGAAAALLFAPQSGRRTRALIRDKAVAYSKEASHFSSDKGRRIADKARGYAHSVKGRLSRADNEGDMQAYI